MDQTLSLVLITADPMVSKLAENAGVERIMVDLERLGKFERQKCRDTWISNHQLSDIDAVAKNLDSAELMVRIDPLKSDSAGEIDEAIDRGAQLIMLPMFKSLSDIDTISEMLEGRCRFVPLIETKEAFAIADQVINHDGVDEVFIGLNDLHLSLGLEFMFEPLADGSLESACRAFERSGKPYGFGGIARVGEGDLPAEMILQEHARLGSTRVNLSRTFARNDSIRQNGAVLQTEVAKLLEVYDRAKNSGSQVLEDNHQKVRSVIKDIIEQQSNNGREGQAGG